jgi:hypothetical protein
MKTSKTLLYLSLLVALLATVYAGVGLFSQGGDGPFTFTTLHGETVEMYGRGIYGNDSAFFAPVFRGTDAVTLFLCVPALIAAALLYRRGTLRGRLFLASMLAYYLYNSASLAFGAAYNSLLLVYIACASASLFAFVLAFRSIDLPTLAAHTSAKLPHRWSAVFLFVAGLSLVIWLVEIVGALVQGTIPANLGPYHTEATYTLDLGVILPIAYLAGILIWRRNPLGTLLACIMITLNLIVGLAVAGQSVMQALDGIVLTPGEYAAFVAPFITLSLIATGLLASIFRNLSEPIAPR